MPKINKNGTIREMSAKEVAEFERMAAELPPPEPDPNEEWKLQIEAALIELAALYGGEA